MKNAKLVILILIAFTETKMELKKSNLCLDLINLRLTKIADKCDLDFSTYHLQEDLVSSSTIDDAFYLVDLTITQQSFDKTNLKEFNFAVTNSVSFEETLDSDSLITEEIAIIFSERIEIRIISWILFGFLIGITGVQIAIFRTIFYKS